MFAAAKRPSDISIGSHVSQCSLGRCAVGLPRRISSCTWKQKQQDSFKTIVIHMKDFFWGFLSGLFFLFKRLATIRALFSQMNKTYIFILINSCLHRVLTWVPWHCKQMTYPLCNGAPHNNFFSKN